MEGDGTMARRGREHAMERRDEWQDGTRHARLCQPLCRTSRGHHLRLAHAPAAVALHPGPVRPLIRVRDARFRRRPPAAAAAAAGGGGALKGRVPLQVHGHVRGGGGGSGGIRVGGRARLDALEGLDHLRRGGAGPTAVRWQTKVARRRRGGAGGEAQV